MKNLIEWIIWLFKNSSKNTTLSFWEKNTDIYINGNLIIRNNGWNHIVVVSKNIPHESWIDSIISYSPDVNFVDDD